MDGVASNRTIHCLGPDEILHVASRLDGLSLARLECASRRFRDSVRSMESVWHRLCVEVMSSRAFNPNGIPAVTSSSLCGYLGLHSSRQLYVALVHLPCVPVGIWYRTDAAAQPEGELVSIYADGRGAYRMSPIDHSGGVLRQIELMRTNLCTTSYEVFQDYADQDQLLALTQSAQLFASALPTLSTHIAQGPPPPHAPASPAAITAAMNATGAEGPPDAPAAAMEGAAVGPSEPRDRPGPSTLPTLPSSMQAESGAGSLGTGQHVYANAYAEAAMAVGAKAGGAVPMDSENLAPPFIARKADGLSCVVRYLGDSSGAGATLSSTLAAAATAAMQARLRTIAAEHPSDHPQRGRVLWPATLFPEAPPTPPAQSAIRTACINSTSNPAAAAFPEGPLAGLPGGLGSQTAAAASMGDAVRNGSAATGALQGECGAFLGGGDGLACRPPAHGMCVRMVVPKPTLKGEFVATQWHKLNIRTPLEWARSPLIQHLHQHIAAAPHLNHISVPRSFFIGSWEPCLPSFQACAGACTARPPVFRSAGSSDRDEAAAAAPQQRCMAPPETLAAQDRSQRKAASLSAATSRTPDDDPSMLRSGHSRQHCGAAASGSGENPVDAAGPVHACAHAAVDEAGAAKVKRSSAMGATAQLPAHEVVQISLWRLQQPPRQMLKAVRAPKLASAVQLAKAATITSGVDVCDLFSGIWKGLYPGHGHEIVEVSVARSESGTRTLPPHLHASYLQTGSHPWPIPPTSDQIHLMKLRGDRNVPACQCTLIADLRNWRWGPLDWQQFTLPICYVREVRGDNLDMEIWQHQEKRVLGSCPGWCQINKWPSTWNPEWVPALLILLDDGGKPCLADLVNLGRFPHLMEFRPVYISEQDEPGWLPVQQR